jgi:hypothetical protein
MGRFRGISAGPSSGQDFRRQGTAGKDYATAAADIEAMSNRFLVVGKQAAEDAADIMEEEIVKYVDPNNNPSFTYSEGRLAATIGTWKPGLIKDVDVLRQAEVWAENEGVDNIPIQTRDINEITEMGAFRSVKHVRGSNYSAEVGTFTPYAGLVEDGGTMPIHPYGKMNITMTATWHAHHMFKNGMFDSYGEIEKAMELAVRDAL